MSRVQLHQYRVFVFGVEVTRKVSSIGISNSDGVAPGSCSVVLNSDEDVFIYRGAERKAVTINQDDGSTRADSFLAAEVDRMLAVKEAALADQAVVSGSQNTLGQQFIADGGQFLFRTTEETQQASRKVPRYMLDWGSSVFHTSDPVRVFAEHDGVWSWRFTGRVVSARVDKNFVNGQVTLSLDCEDVRRPMRYARVGNPGVESLGEIQQDVFLNTFNQNFYGGLSVPEAVFTGIFGPEGAGTEEEITEIASNLRPKAPTVPLRFRGARQRETLTKNVNATSTGTFVLERSGVFIFDTPGDYSQSIAQVNNAQIGVEQVTSRDSSRVIRDRTYTVPSTREGRSAYDAVIADEVSVDDLEMMSIYDDAAVIRTALRLIDWASEVEADRAYGFDFGNIRSFTEMNEGATVGFIGRHPELYPTDGFRCIVAIPKVFDDFRAVLGFAANTVGLSSSFSNRFDILFEILTPLDFSCYTTGRGDFVVEFPFRDFMPTDFTPISRDVAVEVFDGSSVGRPMAGDEVVPRGASSLRVLDMQLVSVVSRAFNHEKIKNLVTMTPGALYGIEGLKVETFRAVVLDPGLIAQHGVRAESLSPKLNFGFDEQTALPAAALYGQLQIAKSIADANLLDVGLISELGNLHPNRMVEVGPERVVACIRSVQRDFDPFTGRLDLRMTLDGTRAGRLNEEGRLVYPQLVAGFSFARLFGLRNTAELEAVEAAEAEEKSAEQQSRAEVKAARSLARARRTGIARMEQQALQGIMPE